MRHQAGKFSRDGGALSLSDYKTSINRSNA